MLTNVHIVAQSGNSKTGDIPVTYRPMDTCPSSCAFLPTNGGGCYGTGRIFGIARKYAAPAVSHDAAVAKLNKASRTARFLRDRVVGDVVATDGTFDVDYIESIAAAARTVDLIPFGYTAAWRQMSDVDITRVAAAGYTLNASCQTTEDIERAVALGLPATVAGDDWQDGDMVAGRRIVTCPAQTRDDVTCASCGLCARPNRKAVVRFTLHGTAKRKAGASVARRMAEESTR